MARADPALRSAIVVGLMLCGLVSPSFGTDHSVALESARSGGALSVRHSHVHAFASPAESLSPEQLRVFAFGNRLFNTAWIMAPGSAEAFDGLGPTFNRASCAACHVRDGRGRPPLEGERALLSMVIRISQPGHDQHGMPLSVPGYGTQLNDRAIQGVDPEARITIEYSEISGKYADGETYTLRKPRIVISHHAYGPFPAGVLKSARVAPAVFGLGLLEAIPEATIRAWADPDDADRDGISGRSNEVWSVHSNKPMLGRFGWKASAPTLSDQNAQAALNDIGITSRLFPDENCPFVQVSCREAGSGGHPEISDAFLQKLEQYLMLLGVPARRGIDDPLVKAGAAHFLALGCADCHRPTMRTGEHAIAALSQQTIHPYTDLLLHDMGPGLADQRPEGLASGQEWRTPPLWGLGLIEVVNEHNFLLHDGRARGFAEAILWHGGEASAAAEGFRTLPKPAREALLAFLRSL